MKRILCLVLIITLLTTGCSFIGQKNADDDEPIIPVAVDSAGGGNVLSDSTSAAIDTSSNSQTAVNSAVSGSAISTEAGDLYGNNLPVDNGTGKGVSSNSSDKDSVFVTLYYRDKTGVLIPVTRKVTKQEGIAKAAVGGLVDEAVTREQLDYYGLYPVLPKGTKIKGMTIKNGSAVIDFSKEFQNLSDKTAEQLAVTSVVYTLTGFKNIADVSIRVEGKPAGVLVNGTDLSAVRNRGNTFINSKDTELKQGYIKCDLYYMTTGNDQYNYIVPVSTQLENTDESQLPAVMFAELSKKPSENSFFTSVPEGTRLLSCNMQEDMAVLDFSSQITNYGGNEKEDGLLNQIYYTINQLKGIAKAKILVDGKAATLPEGSEIAFAKSLPNTYNQVMDK